MRRQLLCNHPKYPNCSRRTVLPTVATVETRHDAVEHAATVSPACDEATPPATAISNALRLLAENTPTAAMSVNIFTPPRPTSAVLGSSQHEKSSLRLVSPPSHVICK